MQHIVSVHDFSPAFLEMIFEQTHCEKSRKQNDEPLRGQTLVSLFYTASTRTRLSFERAMLKLGGNYIGTENAEQFSSHTKGETLEDTVRVVSGYGDVIVLRHTDIGAAERAVGHSCVPIINAGDGGGEHPTQALLDLFTIKERFPKRDDLTVTFVGDLKEGRTVHSLAYLLASISSSPLASAACVLFVAPEGYQADEALRGIVHEHGIECEIHYALTPEITATSDVIYMTRVQKERHAESPLPITGDAYALTSELAKCLAPDALVLHPLPRNSEIPDDIDALPQAGYFEQAQNGLFIRMALLRYLLA